jgi:hypothetical protein
MFVLVLIILPFSRSRFLEGPVTFIQPTAKFDESNLATRNFYYRKNILGCCLDLVKGPELVYGYGTGDFNDVLQGCYARKNYSLLQAESLDSQCEYFAEMHRQGLIGLLVFLALLIVPFYYSIKYNSPLYAVFIILFGVTALFENALSSQKGVTFFALLCPLLHLSAKRTWKEKTMR